MQRQVDISDFYETTTLIFTSLVSMPYIPRKFLSFLQKRSVKGW